MNKEFIPYEQALALKELGFDEPCMYAWCITIKHRVEYDGKISLKTDGNPFGQFYKGKNFNLNYTTNKNKIQCSAQTFSQAFRFFREKYNLVIQYIPHEIDDDEGRSNLHHKYKISEYDSWRGGRRNTVETELNETYEDAELACLNKLIEIAKSK